MANFIMGNAPFSIEIEELALVLGIYICIVFTSSYRESTSFFNDTNWNFYQIY